ncbi:MAG: hypothetical protein WD077_00250 [Bacteroidia bacterium]
MELNRTHKFSLAAIASAAILFNVQSCKKYEDGPRISLKSKKARLVGEWELEKPITSPFGEVNMIIEFEKDGDFELLLEITYSYPGYSGTYDYEVTGEWEFEDNKENIELDFDDGGGKTEWEILRLTSKELWIEAEGGEEYEFEKK